MLPRHGDGAGTVVCKVVSTYLVTLEYVSADNPHPLTICISVFLGLGGQAIIFFERVDTKSHVRTKAMQLFPTGTENLGAISYGTIHGFFIEVPS